MWYQMIDYLQNSDHNKSAFKNARPGLVQIFENSQLSVPEVRPARRVSPSQRPPKCAVGAGACPRPAVGAGEHGTERREREDRLACKPPSLASTFPSKYAGQTKIGGGQTAS